jgi:tripartite-type tricarboxylate transporter receptor subunit TctC
MRAHPGRLAPGSSGIGNVEPAVEWIKWSAGVDLVPFRPGHRAGPPRALNSEIDVVATDLSLAPHAKAGTRRILAVTGAKRAGAAPGIPTVAEQGIRATRWTPGTQLVPRRTPAGIVEVEQQPARDLAVSEVRQRIAGWLRPDRRYSAARKCARLRRYSDVIRRGVARDAVAILSR